MPELPEVETVKIGLQALLPGRQIAAGQGIIDRIVIQVFFGYPSEDDRAAGVQEPKQDIWCGAPQPVIGG
jgi:hypothetical protein